MSKTESHFCMGLLTHIRTMPALKDTGYGLPNLHWNKLNENIWQANSPSQEELFLEAPTVPHTEEHCTQQHQRP